MSGGEAMERLEEWDSSWLAGEPIPVPEPEEAPGINHPQIHALQQAAEQLRATRHWSHVDPDVAAAHREAVEALTAELAHHTHILEPRDYEPDKPDEHPAATGEGTVTVIGNLTAAPLLTRTKAGTPVANLTIASTPRAHDPQTGERKDGETTFVRCTLWRQAAENAAASLAKGTRVIATGTLTTRTYQAKDGQIRTSLELDVHELGASIRFTTARVARRGTRTAWRDPQPVPQKERDAHAEGRQDRALVGGRVHRRPRPHRGRHRPLLRHRSRGRPARCAVGRHRAPPTPTRLDPSAPASSSPPATEMRRSTTSPPASPSATRTTAFGSTSTEDQPDPPPDASTHHEHRGSTP